MGTISLTGLRVFGHHGVLEHERTVGQTFVVDLSLEADLGAAAATDDVDDTVNYAAVAEVVETIVAGSPVNLLETLAVAIADTLLTEFPKVASTEVTVNKPRAPIPVDFANVAVTVQRARKTGGERS